MNYMLDTDVIVDHLRRRRLLELPAEEESFAVSIITVGELYSGVYRSRREDESLRAVEEFLKREGVQIISLSTDTMRRFAKLSAQLDRDGMHVDDFDVLIAATAVEHGLTLLTRNRKHFGRIEGLKVEFVH